jgi:hypothetical protein
MLAFADEGFKGFGVGAARPEGSFDCFPEGEDFLGRELHGSGKAVKDPAKNLFDCVPEALAVGDELLEGDGVLPGMTCGCWGGEDLVDGVQKGPAVMAKHVNICALEKPDVIVNKALKEVEKTGSVSRVIKLGQRWEVALVEVGVRVVGGVVFQRVGRKPGEKSEPFSDVAAGFGGGAEESWAGGPAYLEGIGHD